MNGSALKRPAICDDENNISFQGISKNTQAVNSGCKMGKRLMFENPT
jgi:hypothetical protein